MSRGAWSVLHIFPSSWYLVFSVKRKASQVIQVSLQDVPKSWADHAKLGVDLIGPLIAAIFGLWVLRLTKRIEQNQWKNQKLIEKRILIWDEAGPLMNDIFCYCKRVGSWKDLSPRDVIARKRAVDKIIHLSRPYFSAKFFQSYLRFIASSFATYQGYGADAKIRTSLWEHKNAHQSWDPSWDALIEDPLDQAQLTSAYEEMLRQVQEELAAH